MSNFVFVVSPSGICSVASSRSGRRLSGSALSACARAVLRAVRCSVHVPASLSGCGVAVRGGCRASAVRACVRGLRPVASVSSPVSFPPALLLPARFASALSAVSVGVRSRWGSVVARAVRGVLFPSGAPSGLSSGLPPVQGLPPASGSGSLLLFSTPGFRSAVAGGACPVSLALSSFSWPVRSAVLWAVALVLRSRALRALFAPGGSLRSVGLEFVSSAMVVLGYPASSPAPSPIIARRFLKSCLISGLPDVVSSIVPKGEGRCSSSAVHSALSSLSRCLRWLSSRTSGLPNACMPAIAFLAMSVLSSCYPPK